jgi:hypothetical protein
MLKNQAAEFRQLAAKNETHIEAAREGIAILKDHTFDWTPPDAGAWGLVPRALIPDRAFG